MRRRRWTPAAVIEEQVERIRAQVGTERVICGLSGGVDSAVAALLVYKAVGDQLTCVFVDHGLMRANEAEQVVETFGGHFHVPLVHVRAEERFLTRLAGVTDPETKRKIVGEEFIRVFEEEARKLGDVRFLVQGTLYSDVIESGGDDGVAAKIKSHHNVGGLPADMRMELVEPLRLLFKDEVRRVGEELGMPERLVWRQPFPGPGLAIRIIGDVTAERLDILRAADAVLQEEIRRAGLYRDLWQSFAVLPAIKSVGVQGDERTYAYPVVIRAVTSEDAMTADWARIPYDVLETISNRIINEVPGVNRVALDLSSKPPGHDRVGMSRVRDLLRAAGWCGGRAGPRRGRRARGELPRALPEGGQARRRRGDHLAGTVLVRRLRLALHAAAARSTGGGPRHRRLRRRRRARCPTEGLLGCRRTSISSASSRSGRQPATVDESELVSRLTQRRGCRSTSSSAGSAGTSGAPARAQAAALR